MRVLGSIGSFALFLLLTVGGSVRDDALAQPTQLGDPHPAFQGSRGLGGRPDKLLDSDSPNTFHSDAQLAEGDVGQKSMRFAFLLANNNTSIPFTYYTQDLTASASEGDYEAANTTLRPVLRPTIITIKINGDSIHEGSEQFRLVVTHPVFGTVQAIGTIVDDDPLPNVFIDDVAVAEGGAGSFTTVDVVFRMDRPSGSPIVVHYTTLNGTATTEDADFLAASGDITITPLARTATLPVTVQGDDRQEPPEFFYVALSQSPGAILGDTHGSVTILADDVGDPPSVMVTRPNGGEVLGLGTQEAVTWTSSGGVTVDVLLSRDGGASWEALGEGLYDVGVAYWKVDGSPATHALIKVRVTDHLGRIAEDVSDVSFTIVSTGAQGLASSAEGGATTRLAAGAAARPVETPIARLRLVPNPGPGPIHIDLILVNEGPVALAVVDIQGREIARIAERRLTAGAHGFTWDGRGMDGRVPAGLYFLRCRLAHALRFERFVVTP